MDWRTCGGTDKVDYRGGFTPKIHNLTLNALLPTFTSSVVNYFATTMTMLQNSSEHLATFFPTEGGKQGWTNNNCKYYTVRATYIDLYTIGCAIELPIVWYIQKCMLIWKICFYFSFVHAICSSKKRRAMLRATDSLKRSSRAWTIFNSRDPFTYYDWTFAPLHLCNSKHAP